VALGLIFHKMSSVPTDHCISFY